MKHPNYFCGGALMSWWSSEIVEVLPLLIYFIDVSIRLTSRWLYMRAEHPLHEPNRITLILHWFGVLLKSDRWLVSQISLLFLFLADIVASLIMILGFHTHTFRVTRALRPFMFLFRFRNLRKTFRTLVGAWKNVLILFLLILLQCVGFGVAAYLTMHKSKQTEFKSVGSSIHAFFVLSLSRPTMLTLLQPMTSDTLRWLLSALIALFSIVVNLFLSQLVIAVSFRNFRLQVCVVCVRVCCLPPPLLLLLFCFFYPSDGAIASLGTLTPSLPFLSLSLLSLSLSLFFFFSLSLSRSLSLYLSLLVDNRRRRKAAE